MATVEWKAMIRKSLITWLLIFALVISTATAIEDFTASGTGRILTNACSPAEGEITVTNTGDLVSIYELIPEGKARKWVSFAPQSFTLQPGQTITIQEFFVVPCNAKDAWLDVSIVTPDLELVLSQELLVQIANNLELEPVVYSQEVLACDTAEFSFLLRNPAEFQDTYSLEVLDSPVKPILSHEKITLAPGTEETISVTIRPKDCTLEGDFTPVLVIETEKSRIASEIEMFLRIQDFDIPKIAEGVESIRAGYSAQEAEVEIENIGNRDTVYLLSVDGPDWVSILPDQITIDARGSEKVKLVLQPAEDTPKGLHTITLTAEVVATETEYTKELLIKLGPPGLGEQLFVNNLPLTIGAIIVLIILAILIYYGVKRYNTPEARAKRAEKKKENDRLRKERKILHEQKRKEKEKLRKEKEAEKESKKEAKLKEKEREAKEVERKEREIARERLKAQKSYDKQLRKDHLVIPRDTIISGIKQPRKMLWKLALLLLVLILVGFGLTFRTAIAENAQSAVIGLVVLVLLSLLQKMRRQRKARGKWKLARADKQLDLNTKWKKGLTQVSFKLESFVNKLKVAVKRAKPTVPSPVRNTYQTFVITPNVEAEEIASARLTFSVKRSWLIRKRISPGDVRLLHLQDNNWTSIAAKPVSTDDKYVTYVANATGLGEFAIVGKSGRAVTKPKKHYGSAFGWTLFGIVAVIALLSIPFLPQAIDEDVVGIPAQLWTQDTQKTLDLSQYFQDPDGDALSFSATGANNINIIFSGSRAIMTPTRGWSGSETVVFNADDGNGGIVKSNPVNLIVELRFKTAAKKASKPVLTASIVLLLVILAILFRKRLKRTIGLE